MGKENPRAEMSFLQHLEVMRWHIVRSVIAILTMAIILFVQKEWLVDLVLLGPAKVDFFTYDFFCRWSGRLWNGSTFCMDEMPFSLLNVEMAGQFSVHIWVSLIGGFIFAFPYLLWEVWRFVKPGLNDRERKTSKWFIFICSFLFGLGVVFAYFLIVPLSVQFLGGYRLSEFVTNQITISSYLNTVSSILLACAILFELPMVVLFLSQAGLLTPAWMRKYRKHALVVTLAISAIITPPDISSQILVSIPVLILYEISIYVSAFANRKRA
ncbi:MAG: twin-arginine translocase subunit TatC [Cryomorphaceae bacterium]|nr:twin-arginine translocase subunit TatC [Cryomorphaceae bacterium]